MKKILSLFLISSLLFVTSCADKELEDKFYGDNPEKGWVHFDVDNTSALFFNEDLLNGAVEAIEIPVELFLPINKTDLKVNYNLVSVEGNPLSVVNSSGFVTFDANTNTSVPIVLNVDLTALQADIYTDHIFDVVLTSTDRGSVSAGLDGNSFPTSFRVKFSAPCFASPLAGMYTVTTNYGYHDFLPDFNPNTTVVEVFEVGTNSYRVQDFSGGLYSVGPYASAYGTDAADNSIFFANTCETITWEDQTDPWGAIIYDDESLNVVDPMTGTFSISWFCTGYGESGLSVYTPL